MLWLSTSTTQAGVSPQQVGWVSSLTTIYRLFRSAIECPSLSTEGSAEERGSWLPAATRGWSTQAKATLSSRLETSLKRMCPFYETTTRWMSDCNRRELAVKRMPPSSGLMPLNRLGAVYPWATEVH